MSINVRTHCSEPEDDDSGESGGGEEDLRAPIIARRDATPVFQAAEHDLDAAAALSATLVVFDGRVPYFPTRDAESDALSRKASLNQSAS